MALLRSFDRKRAGALALVLGMVAAASDADAFVVKKTTRGELVHWDERTVDYTFDPSVAAAFGKSGVDATNTAMGTWSGTVGAPDLVSHQVGDVGVVDPPKQPGFDQKNGVFFMKDGYAPAGKALAITVLTYDNASGRILDADIIVNGSYRFEVLLAGATEATQEKVGTIHASNTDGVSHQEDESNAESLDTTYDLHHVVAHELGHSLGMNDEMENKSALMYRYTAPNDGTLQAPAADDIQGLAELYSTKLEASGNGCGSATVAPKKPSLAASHVAMVATLGLLMFLLLRGRRDRRARIAFVLASAVAVYAMLPTISKDQGNVARASTAAPGQARAKVLSTSTSMEAGLLKTTYQLATTACRATSCPKLAAGSAWGGTNGTITQEVGGQYAPSTGDDVDVSFTALPSSIAPLTQPLGAGAARPATATVRVVTLAQ